MKTTILINLIVNNFKFELLSEHLKNSTGSDIYYQNFKLNNPSILKEVIELIGFPFFKSNQLNDDYEDFINFLKHKFYDFVYYIDYQDLSELESNSKKYIDWLLVQKDQFDKGIIEFNNL